MSDPILSLIAEYERLTEVITPLEERVTELRRTLPVYLRGPACVRLGHAAFYTDDDINAHFDELDDELGPPDAAQQAAALCTDLAAYQAVIAAAEETRGVAELDRQIEQIEEARSAVYEQIRDTPATTFDGLAAHLRFLIDAEEVDILLAGLGHIRRRITAGEYRPAAAKVIGFGT